MQNNILFKVL